MPSGGLDLARPPVDVQRSAARQIAATRLRGVNLYSMGAGGFSRVVSMPTMQRLTPKAIAANPNSAANIQLTELYAQKPLAFKQRITQMFGG
jgi:hypothetical protein